MVALVVDGEVVDEEQARVGAGEDEDEQPAEKPTRRRRASVTETAVDKTAPWEFPADPADYTEPDGGTAEYVVSNDLERLGQSLVDDCPELKPCRALRIVYLYRRTGGNSRGVSRFGRVEIARGLSQYYSHADVYVWVAANNCLTHEFSRYQMEALLYRLLRSVGVTEKDTPRRIPPEWDGYSDEVRRYGAWLPVLVTAQNAFAQQGLGL